MLKRRQSVQGARWRKLDNTAKLFPVIANENLSNVFRISVTLTYQIEPELLKEALEAVLPAFEGFRVKLRRGFFWYYFETNKKPAAVEEEASFPCKFIDPHSSHLYLFRVTYFKNRINLEVFHALADGLGAVNFLKELAYCYIKAKREHTAVIEPLQENSEEHYKKVVEDSYLKHYEKVKRKKYTSHTAYRLTGEHLPLDGQNVVHGYIHVPTLKKICREAGVSITKYLATLLIWSVYQVYLGGKPNVRPVGINLPINLRAFFDSETHSNFFAVTVIDYLFDHPGVTFRMVLKEVSRQMDEKIVKEKLAETISYNVSSEKKWYIRIAPLVLKHLTLNLIFLRTSRAHTLTLSNLGPIEVLPEYESDILRFHAMIGVSKKQEVKCTVCAYKDEMAFTFNSIFQDIRLQTCFFDTLEREGVPVRLESNGYPDKDHDHGTYPQIQYDKDKYKKVINLFYLLLISTAAILGAVNLVAFRHIWWSMIAIASIFYVMMTVRYSITRQANLAFKLVIQSLGAQLLLIIIDYVPGYTGWSVNYAIPGVLLFDVLAVVFLIVVNRLNWQSYFMYQIALTIFSFIPMIFWALGWITRPVMSVITMIISVAILGITIVLGDRSVKNELKRRFHL